MWHPAAAGSEDSSIPRGWCSHPLRDRAGQLAAPRAALMLAMIAPASAMEMNERRNPLAKKRHRKQARATSSKTIVASATTSDMVRRDQERQGVQDAAEERA